MTDMQNLNIGFIGGGNMAEAIVAGLMRGGHASARVRVTDISKDRLATLEKQYAIVSCEDIQSIVGESDVLVLAVKPQQIDAVLAELQGITPDCTIISIAAGIDSAHICASLGDDVSLVRVMPNTPCLVGEGMSVLFTKAGDVHHQRGEYVLAASGKTAWIDDEQLMHAVTAVSGSGPAYFFLLAELMQATGQGMGLTPELSKLLVNQTASGAAKMLVESGKSAELLRQQVTSPGGTTQAALETMFEGHFPDVVRNALTAAAKRSRELA